MTSTPPQSVHDNWLYAETFDHERRRIVLHTVYPHGETPDDMEWTDVIFEGVVTHHFQEANYTSGPDPACVLFDIVDRDAFEVLRKYAELLASTRNRGWPLLHYTSLEDLAARLQTGGARCYEVQGVCGIQGFVIAASIEFRTRESRAEFEG